jgi:glycosyltransferase involved in cell wall biosynthesis
MPLDELALSASVILATRNRADMLASFLESFAAQHFKGRVELIVVDNGSTDHTATVLRDYSKHLLLIPLYEPTAGKSRSLNRALPLARGHLLAFTDDDVELSGSWVSDLLSRAEIHPDCGVFCGPIVPLFPPNTPQWLCEHRFAAEAFGKFVLSQAEGPLPSPSLPFGANFAVRANWIKGMRFRTDLGPSDAGFLLAEDSEFLGRLRARGAQFLYIPSAVVFHHIRPEATNTQHLFDRAFHHGRSIILAAERVVIKRHTTASDDCTTRFTLGALLNFYLGQLCQLDISRLPGREILISAITSLNLENHSTLLCGSAEKMLPGLHSLFICSSFEKPSGARNLAENGPFKTDRQGG